jgi:hypothetical protein
VYDWNKSWYIWSHNSEWIKMCLSYPIWHHCSLRNWEANCSSLKDNIRSDQWQCLSEDQPVPQHHPASIHCLSFIFIFPLFFTIKSTNLMPFYLFKPYQPMCVYVLVHVCVRVYRWSIHRLNAYTTSSVTHQCSSVNLCYRLRLLSFCMWYRPIIFYLKISMADKFLTFCILEI